MNLKNVIMVFEDGTQVSLESAEEVSVEMTAGMSSPFLYDSDNPASIIFPVAIEYPFTKVTIQFIVSAANVKTAEYLKLLTP